MKINNKPVMRIAAILALVAASTSAFAQNGDYRRGYDDGYAPERYASYEDRGYRPRIHVEDAAYGVRGATCDARRAVWQEANRSGAIRVGNQLCGDPARGEQKRLRVVYRCGDSEPFRAIARENETLRLSCRRR